MSSNNFLSSSSGERPHVCPHCGKDFSHKHCLNTHLLLHTTERPYQCGECKKCFTLKHHLLTHLRVHTRDRPFVCQECGRAFPLKRHLVTHSKFHAGERPYICEVSVRSSLACSNVSTNFLPPLRTAARVSRRKSTWTCTRDSTAPSIPSLVRTVGRHSPENSSSSTTESFTDVCRIRVRCADGNSCRKERWRLT